SLTIGQAPSPSTQGGSGMEGGDAAPADGENQTPSASSMNGMNLDIDRGPPGRVAAVRKEVRDRGARNGSRGCRTWVAIAPPPRKKPPGNARWLFGLAGGLGFEPRL